MDNFHLTGVEISNYRRFDRLKITDFGVLNIVGGFNGVGKSSLLEALFHVADRNNPMALLRPYQWRQIPLAPQDNLDALKQAFHKGNTTSPIEIDALRTTATIRLKYKFGHQEITEQTAQAVAQGEVNKITSESTFSASGEGIHITSHAGNKREYESRIRIASNGFVVQVLINSITNQPVSVILGPSLRGNDIGLPARYSKLVKNGREDHILQFIRLVHPEIIGLRLFVLGGSMILHANIGNDNWIPLPFLGEGAVALTSAVLALADCTGGMVFLDELDAAVHFSKLADMWSLVRAAARTFQTQVFATTHSDESLRALASIAGNDDLDDTRYFRLRETKLGAVEAVPYHGAELLSAISQGWEVR